MNRGPIWYPVALTICLVVRAETAGPSQDGGKELTQAAEESRIDLAIGGVGGVYFLASPGELAVDLEKRDKNGKGVRTDLRAILVGPDRRVLEEVTLPDDGLPRGSGPGPPQRAHLLTRVARKGVYALNVTVSEDRYGDEIVWGFRTNCPQYLIETSRGHRDERRQEPIVLAAPDRPGDVCFVPRNGTFGIDIANLPSDMRTLPVYDADGATIKILQVEVDGRASGRFDPDDHRAAVPWQLHLTRQQATIRIDGVTHWDQQDLYPDLPYWTPAAASYFPFQAYRWILTPYSRTVYGSAGNGGEMAFQVHNNSDRPKSVQLEIEFPDGEWPARLSVNRVVVKPKERKRVSIRYTCPAEGKTRVCHLRARPVEDPSFSTYSTLTVTAGAAPATRPLAMPLVLEPYRHENELFGYLPDYPVDGEMYFDLENRPLASTEEGIAAWRDGQWSSCDFRRALRSRMPELEVAPSCAWTSGTKIAFDRDNDVYLPATCGSQVALLHSNDGGRTFTAYGLGQSGGLDIEQFSGHNVPDGPPPVLRSIRTGRDKKLIWRQISDLELFVPRKADGRLTVGQPILVSRQSLGVEAHSGLPSAVISRGSKVHVVWAEATDPRVDLPGVPTYVTTFDRQTGMLAKPVLVGYGAPPNDVHNRPCLVMDSEGYLHVLTGTHGRPFHYARSLKPNDAHSGWTQAEPVGGGLRQTYIGLVCGPDDTLHLVCRLWREDPAYFPSGASFATLAYQRKRPGQPWESPRTLIVPPFSEYSIFYHRLTIDRQGRLFLSYDYWSTYWFYRTDHLGSRRALMTSPNGGETWKLAQTEDLR